MTRPLLIVPPGVLVPGDVAAAADVLATSSPAAAASAARGRAVVMLWDPAFGLGLHHVDAHSEALGAPARGTRCVVVGAGPENGFPAGAPPLALLSLDGNDCAAWIVGCQDLTPSAVAVRGAGDAQVLRAPGHEWAPGADRVAAAARVGRSRAAAAGSRAPRAGARAIGGVGRRPPPERALRRMLMSRVVPGVVARAAARRLPVPHLEGRVAYWRAVAATLGRRRTATLRRRVPVLMFHAFARPGERPSRYVVAPGALDRRLRLLRAAGYRPVTLDGLVEALRAGRPPRRAYVVTIDDGYDDNAAVGEPVFAAHGTPATVFFVTGAMGGANAWDDDGVLRGRTVMSADEARAMHARGLVSLGAHTRSHPRLTCVPPGEADEEIAGSLRDVGALTGGSAAAFAYPHGDRDERVIAAARDAGAACALSVRHGRAGLADDLWDLPRIDVRGDEPVWTFARMVLLGGERRGPSGA